jgi:hypothetical protein
MANEPIKKVRGLPPYLAHVARSVNPVVEIVNRGLVVSTSTVIAERISDGRIRLRLRPGAVGIAPPGSPSTASVIQAVYVAGSGYTAGDVLTAIGGIFSIPFTLMLDAVDGMGVPTGWHWGGGYVYITLPTNPVDFSGGTGTGAQFDLTWQ